MYLLRHLSRECGCPAVSWLDFVRQLWRKVCSRFSEVVFLNPAKGEIIVAVSTYVLGVWLFHPTASFQEPVYALLAQIASENVWATLMIVLGVTQLTMLLIGRSSLRRCCSIIMVALWTFLSLAFIVNPQPLAVELGLLCFVQAISSAWSFFQIGWYSSQQR